MIWLVPARGSKRFGVDFEQSAICTCPTLYLYRSLSTKSRIYTLELQKRECWGGGKTIKAKMEQQEINIDIDRSLVASRLREKLVQKPSLASGCSCIFKVPSTLLTPNKHLFKPSLVSIGPYHSGNNNLQPMESIKRWYLQCLLDRKPTPETDLESFVESVKQNLRNVLASYAEPVLIEVEELVEMMVIDGCFVVEYFRKYGGIVQASEDDPLFAMSWTRKVLVIDLLLLENQLPWCVLDCLYMLTKTTRDEEKLPLSQLAHNCLDTDTLRFERIQVDPRLQIKHLLDLQRSIILDSSTDDNQNQDDNNENHKNNVKRHKRGEPIRMGRKGWIATPCVTELLQAGVKFEVGNRTNLMNIKFDKGVLTIPPIQVLDNAESLFRNLIAYEQCDRSLEDKITSYAGLLDNLINTSADLDYLRQEKIIACYLSTEEVSEFFQRLYKDAHVVRYAYADVSHRINAYCHERWPRWRVMLARDYFGNPWSIVSLVAGIIILVLTFLQTFYAIIR